MDLPKHGTVEIVYDYQNMKKELDNLYNGGIIENKEYTIGLLRLKDKTAKRLFNFFIIAE